jgi:hypothetical protein
MVLGGPLPQGIVSRQITGLARISCSRLGELITSDANNLGFPFEFVRATMLGTTTVLYCTKNWKWMTVPPKVDTVLQSRYISLAISLGPVAFFFVEMCSAFLCGEKKFTWLGSGL